MRGSTYVPVLAFIVLVFVGVLEAGAVGRAEAEQLLGNGGKRVSSGAGSKPLGSDECVSARMIRDFHRFGTSNAVLDADRVG